MLVIILCSIMMLCLSGLMFCFGMLLRNELVYNFRTDVLNNKIAGDYNKLPDYDTMMSYFWIPLRIKYWENFKYPECDSILEAFRNYIKYKRNGRHS